MADYYTYASFVIPVTIEQQTWAMADIQRRDDYDGPDDTEQNRSICADVEQYSNHLWIHGDVGDLDSLCDWLHAIMQQFQISGAWVFQTSGDCSKERLDAFGGCGVIVTANGIDSMSTRQWIAERLDARSLASQPDPDPPLPSTGPFAHPTAGYDFLMHVDEAGKLCPESKG